MTSSILVTQLHTTWGQIYTADTGDMSATEIILAVVLDPLVVIMQPELQKSG